MLFALSAALPAFARPVGNDVALLTSTALFFASGPPTELEVPDSPLRPRGKISSIKQDVQVACLLQHLFQRSKSGL